MSEKVKLPKEIYEVLRNIYGIPEVGGEDSPLSVISDLTDFSKEKDGYGVELGRWLATDETNQWKLIDALRYGYESEPEQLYYVIMPIDRTHCFLNQNEDDGEVFFDEKDAVMRIKVKFTMPEILAIDPRYKAFAVPVEEVDECTN